MCVSSVWGPLKTRRPTDRQERSRTENALDKSAVIMTPSVRRGRNSAGTQNFLVGILKFSLTAAGRMRSSAMSLPASVLLLATSILLPILTFTAAYAVSERTNPEVWLRKGYFLSAAIDLPPASNFGSLGLTLTIFAFTCVVVVRHHIVATRLALRPTDMGLTALHRTSLSTALLASFGGHGVAAYQHQASNLMHNSFAAVFVLCGLGHFVLESLVERRACLSSRLARATRLMLVLVSSVSCATFLSHVLIEETCRTDIGIGKWRAALAEIMTVLCFIVYLATYSRSFHETSLTLSVSYTPGVQVHERRPPPTDAKRSRAGSSPLRLAGRGGEEGSTASAAPSAHPPSPNRWPVSALGPDGVFATGPIRLRRCFSDNLAAAFQ